MSDLANTVLIDRAQRKLYINGVEFPWCLTGQGPTIDDTEDLARITITFLAENIVTIGVKSPAVHMAELTLTHARQRLDAALHDARDGEGQLAVRDAQIEVRSASQVLAAAQATSDKADQRLREALATA